MLAAPKQRIEIAPFDSRVLESFRLPGGQLPHRANQQILGADEMRKKKKAGGTWVASRHHLTSFAETAHRRRVSGTIECCDNQITRAIHWLGALQGCTQQTRVGVVG